VQTFASRFQPDITVFSLSRRPAKLAEVSPRSQIIVPYQQTHPLQLIATMSKHKRQKKKPISGTEAAEKSSKPKTEVTAVVKAYAHPTSEPIVKAPAKAPAKTPAKTPAKPADKSTNTTTARATGKPTLKSAITPGVNPVAKSGVKQGGKQTVKPAVNPAVELGEKPGPKITAKAGLDSRAKPGAKPRREAKKKRFNVVDAWQEYWGQGVLTDWQRLCQDLGVHGDLTTKDKCREVCIISLRITEYND
jgi:hypothetical protein